MASPQLSNTTSSQWHSVHVRGVTGVASSPKLRRKLTVTDDVRDPMVAVGRGQAGVAR